MSQTYDDYCHNMLSNDFKSSAQNTIKFPVTSDEVYQACVSCVSTYKRDPKEINKFNPNKRIDKCTLQSLPDVHDRTVKETCNMKQDMSDTDKINCYNVCYDRQDLQNCVDYYDYTLHNRS